ncbi:NAD(P)/FAD-dependent oxidoreductase [Prochlorococcus marinus]|uniref:Dehydrogenase n=1 Tax=Prochlorococcus marinus XMU1408 TaxID=2213228 RepID=A0A318R197_PROMR|nr:NAD(P)/FAD-dependent oxidoreductase [Prochlorococcus marinus]MBW3041547.1 dehydrogenase [Prochlorococcus marinus str. XMU1408]PYE02705.1 dehydrogenase [Prochlorococcus marinus XMU1408]
MTIIDVAIIGGGASGCTTAFHLAYKGKSVCILEKNNSSAERTCGGGMSAAVQKWFPFNLMSIVEEVITNVEFSWCNTDKVVAELSGDSPFWILKRENLDSFLLGQALNSGCNILTTFIVVKIIKKNSNIWQITALDGRQIEAKAVVIADGSQSQWPKTFNLGPKNLKFASTFSGRIKRKGKLRSETARFEFGLVKNGFAWAFPLKDEINIGIGTFLDSKNSIPIDKILKSFLPDLGLEPCDVTGQEKKLRIWNGHNNLSGDGILLVGDAASLCDPFLAEGLRPALMSGYEAANCLVNWLDGEINNLDNYTNNMKKNWGNSMAWGKRISQVFYRFPKVGYQLGVKRPTAPERIAQILSGEMSYEDIAKRVINRLIFQKSRS